LRKNILLDLLERLKGRIIKMNRRKIDKEIKRKEEKFNSSQNP